MPYRVKVIAGPGVGSELELDDGEMTIGRAPDNALVINDNNVSRIHARFRANGNRIAVMDAGSRNGVYVNDRKLDGDELQPLGPGDRVVIGQSILEVFAGNGMGAPPRPRTGTANVRGPAPRPAGSNGVTAPVPNSRAPVPAGRGAAPAPRPTTGAVAARRPAPPARTAGPGGPRVTPKKEAQSALSKPMLVGIVGLAVLFAVGTMMIRGGGANGGTDSTDAQPTFTPVIPPVPGLPQGGAISEDKCSPKCQRFLDLGDSQRDGNNLIAARDSFQNAVDLEPTCLSCAVRLEAVERSIEEKIKDYEKSGILSFEKGDYQRAIDSWEIALEFMPDPAKLKDATKKARADGRRRELKKKMDEAAKLVERQPQ